MDDELLRALCALAAFCIPLGIAALVVRLQASRRIARARARRQALRHANPQR